MTIPTVSWNQVRGNPYLRKVQPEMLLESGHSERTEINLKSDGYNAPKSTVLVLYDEGYVIQKLIVDFILPLKFHDYNQLQKLLAKAWKKFNTQREHAPRVKQAMSVE